jgi:hypothetical protein
MRGQSMALGYTSSTASTSSAEVMGNALTINTSRKIIADSRAGKGIGEPSC